jgi:hypothetical protein
MFNVQFTWQIPFILLVHSDFQDAPEAAESAEVEMERQLVFLSFGPEGKELSWQPAFVEP